MKSIGIAEALSKIKNAEEFSLVFCRSSRDKGKLKSVDRAVSGFNYKQFKPRDRKEYVVKQKRARHSLRGTIPIIDLDQDLETNGQLTPLISHIMFFNNMKVIH